MKVSNSSVSGVVAGNMERTNSDMLKMLLSIYNVSNATLKRRCYRVLLVALPLISTVFSIWINLKTRFIYMKSMDIFFNTLVSISLILQGTAIKLTSFLHPASWKIFLKDLHAGNDAERASNGARARLLLLHVMFLVKVLWNAFAWTHVVRFDEYKYHVYRDFYDYYGMIAVVLMVYINRAIKEKIQLMNGVLRPSFQRRVYRNSILPAEFKPTNGVTCFQIRYVQRTYRKLTRLIKQFSSIFGYQILFIMAKTVVVMLESLHNALRIHDVIDDTSKYMYGRIMVLCWCATSTLTAVVRVCLFKGLCYRFSFADRSCRTSNVM